MPKFAFKLQDKGSDHYEVGTVFIDRHPDVPTGDSRYIESAREYLRRKELKRCLHRLTPDQHALVTEKVQLLEAAGRTKSAEHAELLMHDQEAPRTLAYLLEVPTAQAAHGVHSAHRRGQPLPTFAKA